MEAFLLPQNAERRGYSPKNGCIPPLRRGRWKVEAVDFISGSCGLCGVYIWDVSHTLPGEGPDLLKALHVSSTSQFVCFTWGQTFSKFTGSKNIQRGTKQAWVWVAQKKDDWGRGEDKTWPSCHSFLQQLLPLLLPQGLQVIRPLQSSLSEEREIWIRAVHKCVLLAIMFGREDAVSHLVLLPKIIDSFFLLRDGWLHSGKL